MRRINDSYVKKIYSCQISDCVYFLELVPSAIILGIFWDILILGVLEYVVGQLSSRTRERVLAVAALDKSLVWFDDVDISAFHSCVVDLWQSLPEWLPLMSACVLVCRRENIGA